MTPASEPPKPTEPFLWPGGDVGCLLVHGLTGTPYDMRFLGERLNAHGYGVHAVQLAGHATQIDDLGASAWTDWYASVEHGLELLSEQARVVVAVGQSLGSLLILRLAFHRPDRIQGLVLLSSPLFLANPWPARALPLAPVLRRILPRTGLYVDKQGSDIADPEARRSHPGYDRIPLRSVLELADLQREVRQLLPRIRQPVLAIHGRHDHTAPVGNVEILRELPNLRDTIVLPNSFHVISVDLERAQVAQAVSDFVGGIAGEQRAEPAA